MVLSSPERPPHNPIEGCSIGHHTFQTLPPTVPSSPPFHQRAGGLLFSPFSTPSLPTFFPSRAEHFLCPLPRKFPCHTEPHNHISISLTCEVFWHLSWPSVVCPHYLLLCNKLRPHWRGSEPPPLYYGPPLCGQGCRNGSARQSCSSCDADDSHSVGLSWRKGRLEGLRHLTFMAGIPTDSPRSECSQRPKRSC